TVGEPAGFHLVSSPSNTGEIQQQTVTKLPRSRLADWHALYDEVALPSEANDVEATERREDLVLLTDRFAEYVALDVDCRARELFLTDVSSLERADALDETHGEARRGPQAAERRQIRGEVYLHVLLYSAIPENFPEWP